jgi:hypothetical protein
MELKFRPLTKGLGFHPFSNGLPYSPETPSRTTIPQTPLGTGAISGGRPNFAFPSVPARIPVPAPTVATPSVAPSPPAILQRELGWDYLGRRFFAFIMDSIINVFLGALTLAGSLWNQKISMDFFFSPSVLLLVVAFLLFFNWCLITAQEVAFGTSLGKRFFGLSIHATAVQTLVRAALFIPSLLLLGLGVAWSMIDSEGRAVHDVLSGIQPEEN